MKHILSGSKLISKQIIYVETKKALLPFGTMRYGLLYQAGSALMNRTHVTFQAALDLDGTPGTVGDDAASAPSQMHFCSTRQDHIQSKKNK